MRLGPVGYSDIGHSGFFLANRIKDYIKYSAEDRLTNRTDNLRSYSENYQN